MDRVILGNNLLRTTVLTPDRHNDICANHIYANTNSATGKLVMEEDPKCKPFRRRVTLQTAALISLCAYLIPLIIRKSSKTNALHELEPS